MNSSDLRPVEQSDCMNVPKHPDQRTFDLYLLANRWNTGFKEDDRGISRSHRPAAAASSPGRR